MSSDVTIKHRNAYLPASTLTTDSALRIHYVDCLPNTSSTSEVILLIHGFPQTSYQFRNIMTPLAQAGYRVIAPDYRGAGESSHPLQGYDKVTMASDLHQLLQNHLGISSKVHLVGHDIGAMIAYAYATEYPQATASITWGECPLPGSQFYDRCKHGIDKFHFTFHCVPDGLPEALVAGKERIYLKQFFDRQIIRTEGIDNAAAVGFIFSAVYRLWRIGFIDGENASGTSLDRDPWWVVIAATSYVGGEWFFVPVPVAIVLGGVMGLIWYGVTS